MTENLDRPELTKATEGQSRFGLILLFMGLLLLALFGLAQSVVLPHLTKVARAEAIRKGDNSAILLAIVLDDVDSREVLAQSSWKPTRQQAKEIFGRENSSFRELLLERLKAQLALGDVEAARIVIDSRDSELEEELSHSNWIPEPALAVTAVGLNRPSLNQAIASCLKRGIISGQSQLVQVALDLNQPCFDAVLTEIDWQPTLAQGTDILIDSYNPSRQARSNALKRHVLNLDWLHPPEVSEKLLEAIDPFGPAARSFLITSLEKRAALLSHNRDNAIITAFTKLDGSPEPLLDAVIKDPKRFRALIPNLALELAQRKGRRAVLEMLRSQLEDQSPTLINMNSYPLRACDLALCAFAKLAMAGEQVIAPDNILQYREDLQVTLVARTMNGLRLDNPEHWNNSLSKAIKWWSETREGQSLAPGSVIALSVKGLEIESRGSELSFSVHRSEMTSDAEHVRQSLKNASASTRHYVAGPFSAGVWTLEATDHNRNRTIKRQIEVGADISAPVEIDFEAP